MAVTCKIGGDSMDDVLLGVAEPAGGDLLARIRDFARHHDAAVVSSAFLSRQLQVDVRTIAAALRRHDIRPRDVESVRGYVTAELMSVGVDYEEAQPVVEVFNTGEKGLPSRMPLSSLLTTEEAKLVRTAGLDPDRLVVSLNEAVPASDAIAALSAGAGHDMTPALRAAGML